MTVRASLSHPASCLLLLLCAAGCPARGQAFRCDLPAPPARVVEQAPFKLTATYTVPQGKAHLHCEMKNLSHAVIGSEVVEVSGTGKRTLTLRAPAQAEAEQILVALWLGEDWREPLGAIVQTGNIRVISRAEQRRLDQMKADVEATLKRLGYRRSEAGNVAVLDDALPGFDRSASKTMAATLATGGRLVTRIDAAALCNPFLLTPERFDVLVLTDSRVYPGAARDPIQAFVEAGGHLVALGGPAFSHPVWEVGGRWLDRDGVLKAFSEAPGRRVFMDFEQADASAWRRESNETVSPAGVAFDAPGPDGRGRCARFSIANLTGWDTFASPELAAPFPAGHELTCFQARGDAATSQMSVEWREKDGSRWIAVVPLAREWKRHALPLSAFHYWHDSASPGRGGAGDHLRPENVARLVIGLAFTHTTTVGGGRHEFWVDDLSTAPMPTDLAGANEAIQGAASAPVLEGVSPAYKVYPISTLGSVKPDPRQVVWQPAGLPQPAATLAPHARPQGTGFGKERRWRWVPLLQATNQDGKVAGSAAVLVLNGKAPFRGSACVSWPATEPGYFSKPPVQRAVVELVARLLDGVFLYEGGSRYYAYADGESVDLGAEVANWGRRPANVAVEVAVAEGEGGKRVFAKRFTLAVAPGKRERVQETWVPRRFDTDDYVVTVALRRGGRAIDSLRHPLSVWRPSPEPKFMTTRAGDFILDGRRWYAHGVNYMPSSGVGVDDGQYFESWLDPQPYDPDVIEQDLADVEAIGMNMVSVFIYYRSRDSHNLLDLLIRCRRHGIKVNLSLRPGTPMDFLWDQMRPLIEKHHLAQEDTVFAYDLAWEPWFGPYTARKQWDGEWEKWALARYGSVEAAEKAWGFAMPRADGKVTGPTDEQVARPGPGGKMAAAYRRFVDDLLQRKYAEARRLVRSVDPNHLVSFRMSAGGDPTCGQGGMPYDLKGLAGAVDIVCPEGYGRIGDWERVKPGWFTAAYSRAVAPDTPIMWAEFGFSTWDSSRGAPSPEGVKFQEQFYRDFYEMALRSGANGTVAWWFPGGFRTGENSDYGILSPDRTWRPVTHVIHDYAARMTAEREIPKPDVLLPFQRDEHPDGIWGVYGATKDAFWKAVDEGKTPGLRWEEGER